MRFLLVLLLCGCASTMRMVEIDYSVKPPADWPVLEERLTYADKETIQRWCNVPKHLQGRIYNCAVMSFTYGLCMIYLSDNTPESLAHERAHCQGYGHVGDAHSVHRAWDVYKRTKKEGLFAQ